MVNKDAYSESDIRSKYIDPAVKNAGWEQYVTREVYTDGQIQVVGKKHRRGKRKFVDYLLTYPAYNRLAIIEAKKHTHSEGDGMQQGLSYAASKDLQVPYVFTSNGDSFIFHNRLAKSGEIEKRLSLDELPTPQQLYKQFLIDTNANNDEKELIETPFQYSKGDKAPRYYQVNAINNTLRAFAKGQKHIMFVMATGTGKTYTAFQIIWRLIKSQKIKKVLYLVDRNILADQPLQDDFRKFGDEAVKLNRKFWNNKAGISSYKVYIGLYQQMFGEDNNDERLYKNFKPDFFDLIVIDEAHRSSATEDSSWREILDYFAGENSKTTVIGMTATPKETMDANLKYYGEPVYEYSLKQGIQDGFLAPYKVIRVGIDKDLMGYRPTKGKLDDNNQLIEDREYNQKDFDRNIILPQRTQQVAKFVSNYMKKNDERFAKTIVFGDDIEHANRLRMAFINENPDLVNEDNRYVMKITGDDQEGKDQLENFQSNEEKYPTIVTTSQLLRTGVNVKNVKFIVLDANIESTTEFKQIIGRGTRLNPSSGKFYFTIIDFKNVTRKFSEKDFDGDPLEIQEVNESDIPEEDDGSYHEDTNSEDDDLPKNDEDNGKKAKYVVSDVDANILTSQTSIIDKDGNLITENIIDFSKRNVIGQYPQLYDFLNAWNKSDKKATLIEEMENNGVFIDEIRKSDEFKDFDDFDLIVHLAYDQPALTKSERINNVKKQGILFKYKDQARAVINALLDKYQDTGITIKDIEDTKILDTKDFDKFGGKLTIVKYFGGPKKYKEAIKSITNELFETI